MNTTIDFTGLANINSGVTKVSYLQKKIKEKLGRDPKKLNKLKQEWIEFFKDEIEDNDPNFLTVKWTRTFISRYLTKYSIIKIDFVDGKGKDDHKEVLILNSDKESFKNKIGKFSDLPMVNTPGIETENNRTPISLEAIKLFKEKIADKIADKVSVMMFNEENINP